MDTLWRKRALIAVIPFCLVLACAGDKKPPPTAQGGTLDLSTWDFQRNVALNGEWEFYWSQLLSPSELTATHPPVTGMFKMPGTWAGVKVGDNELPGEGFATFRLTVTLPDASRLHGLRFGAMGTAYHLWVNGQLLATNGKVGRNFEEMVPQCLPQVVYFQPSSTRLELVLQISNFRERHGGMWNSTILGTAEGISHERDNRVASQLVGMGIALIMGLYHLWLYALRRRDKASLVFGLFCLDMSLRSVITEDRILVAQFPDINWEALVKLEYFTFYVAAPLAGMFVGTVFPKEMHRRFVPIYTAICSVFILILLVTPARVFTQTLVGYQLLSMLGSIYVAVASVFAVLRRREGALLWASGWAIFVASITLDFLSANLVVDLPFISPAGFVMLILCQASVLSVRFNRAFDDVEKLSTELTTKNAELEAAARVKDEFLASTTHELRTPLNALINLPRSVLQSFSYTSVVHCNACQSDFELEEGEVFNAAEPCPSCNEKALAIKESCIFHGDPAMCMEDLKVAVSSGNRMLNMVNSILDLSKLEAGRAGLRLVPISMPKVVREIAGALRPLADEKRVKVDLLLEQEECLRKMDEENLERILNNLIANAIKYSSDGGHVEVLYKPQGDMVRFTIQDHGRGIAPEHHALIFEKFRQVVDSKFRNQGGTGLGLAICKKVVELHGGRIWVESQLGQGATFHVEMPAPPAVVNAEAPVAMEGPKAMEPAPGGAA